MIDNYKVDKIINVGAAAAVNDLLNIGDVVIGKYIVQHDFDITAFGHSKGYITGVGNGVECNNVIIESIKKAVNSIRDIDFKVKLGTVATGDIFCTDVAMKDKISAKFDADVVDMECGAVAQVAYLSGIPFGAIRGVSDTPNGKNAEDFDKNLDKARYLYSFLFKNKYPRYQINLKLSQIDFVQISYYRYSFYPSKYLVNGSGNKIVFKFNMLDGSQYIIENLVSSDKETFSKGIELMKKNGVRFVDSYHLLDIIRSNKNLDQYIVAIEKEKKHD